MQAERSRSMETCHECSGTISIYLLKKESKIRVFVKTTDNPWDQGKSVTTLDNKVKRTPFQKQNEETKR